MTLDRSDIRLAPEQIESLFPFAFVIDQSMTLVGMGRSLAKLDPTLRLGCAFDDIMRLADAVGPMNFEMIARRARTLCIIDLKRKHAVLRGQFKLIGDARMAMFLGSPWLTEAAALEQLGLDLNDFAVHDPAIDLLHLM